MSTPTPSAGAAGPSFLDHLAAAPKLLGIGLLVAAAAALAIPIAEYALYGFAYAGVFAWGAFLVLLFIVGGAVALSLPETPPRPGEPGPAHAVILFMVSLAGLATALLGVWLPLYVESY